MSVSGKISQIAGLATYPTNPMWSAPNAMAARKSHRVAGVYGRFGVSLTSFEPTRLFGKFM